MTGEEAGQSVGNCTWIHHLEPVGRLWHYQFFGLRYPLLEYGMAFTEDGRGLRTNHRQHGLADARRILCGKPPLVQGGQLDLEKRIKIGNGQLKRARRQRLGNDLPILRSHHACEERIGSPQLVPAFIQVLFELAIGSFRRKASRYSLA